MPVRGWPGALEGWRFLHLSDVHARLRWEPVWDGVVRVVRESGVEAVLCSGDWVESKSDHGPALPWVRKLAEGLRGAMGGAGGGIWSVIGNHDGPKLARHLEGSGIEFVDHRREVIRARGEEIELIGVGGWRRRHARVDRYFRFPARREGGEGVPRIVLGHYPSLIRMVSLHLKPDIYLTGHTHGGQVCVPGWGPVISHDALPRGFSAGVHRWGDTWMNVSRGIGFSDWQIRVWCPPEVTVVTVVGEG